MIRLLGLTALSPPPAIHRFHTSSYRKRSAAPKFNYWYVLSNQPFRSLFIGRHFFCIRFYTTTSKLEKDSSGQKKIKMDKIENISVGPMPTSNFLKPLRMVFTQDNKERFWDFVKLHEGVSIIVFNKSRDVLIFVKQFRPAVFYASAAKATGNNEVQNDIDWSKVRPETGITIELCAGIHDNPKLSAKETAKQEVLEECGYDVPLENFQFIITHRAGIGVSGDKQALFYAEVTDEMKVSAGGGIASEGEMIDVIEMSIPEVQKYMSQDSVPSPGGFLFAISWFLSNKAPVANK